jgi:peptidoglycan/LPS O-acetylase OafA/YrhL
MIFEKPHHLLHPKYRPDIDGLRAIAILLVLLFHGFPTKVSGGFIGVDIFFVISGFLISTIIYENLERGTFNFIDFYARRIKRIFPALLLVLVVSYTLGWFALLGDQYKQLGKHIAAGVGFVSNFVLWEEVGYFDNTAETKPLLHLWSLGIEEQFYVAWPLLLWLSWKARLSLPTITIIIALFSFGLNIKGIGNDATATFYSPQTRFWELLCGSLLAWFVLHEKRETYLFNARFDRWLLSLIPKRLSSTKRRTFANLSSLLGLLFIIYGTYRIDRNSSFPGEWAIIPVLGAVLLIFAGSEAWINRTILSNRILVWFGLISFPLYL